jgi:signal transduction histidine kinase
MRLADLTRLRSLGLGTRIALTMLAALLAIQALNAAVFFFGPRPDFKIYSARWLIEQTQKVVNEIVASPPADQEDIAKRFLASTGLKLRSMPPRPRDARRGPEFPPLQRLAASLELALAGKVRSIEVHSFFKMPGPPPDVAPVMVPPEFEASLPRGALATNESDIPIWGEFEISIETLDGRDFVISQRRPPRFGRFLNPTVVTMAGAVLLIALLSAWTAKRSLRPLDELIAAARRLGVEREPTPIATEHLRDFASIGEAMNEMQVRIKDFVGERTQILAAISHDLRTALTRFRLEAEALPEGDIKQRMIANIDEMEGMISATLTFAGDDLKGERSEPVDVAAVLITISDNFSDMGAPVSYDGPDHAEATCQPTAIRRAFTNLIDNAIKYGKEARIGLLQDRDQLVITIADKGPGIASDDVELAFKPFRRLEQSRSRETGGVGLGLTIARDIIRAHGGSIALANGSQGGLVATIALPATRKVR